MTTRQTDHEELGLVDLSAALKILVVDDSEDIRDLLVRMAERLGHTAQAASDGVEAVELLMVDTYDFMLLDLR